MPFPDEIEDGTGTEASKARIGLAGPTADIRHLEVHDAAGLPAMLVAIQNVLGDETSQQTFTPSWTLPGGITTSTNNGYYVRIGRAVFWSVYAIMSGSTGTVSPGLRFTRPSAWGSASWTRFGQGHRVFGSNTYSLSVRQTSTDIDVFEVDPANPTITRRRTSVAPAEQYYLSGTYIRT